jgi:bacterial/archaeal transporter family protein
MTKTPPWLLSAATAVILWGIWGVFQKLATNQMAPRNVYFISALGALLVVLVILSTSRFPISLNFEGAFFALVAGVCSSLGGLLFLQAMNRGEAAIVITFTALYPAVSIILSFLLLDETITMKQGMGIVLALFSMLLMK